MTKINSIKKIYGIYPGDLKDPEIINNLDEIDLFFSIYNARQSLNKNRLLIYRFKRNIDITEREYAINYMMAQTAKFGVDFSMVKDNKDLLTPSFWDWYKFYIHHFFEVLSNDQLDEFLKKKKNGENVSEYLPKENWYDSARNEKIKYRRTKKHNI